MDEHVASTFDFSIMYDFLSNIFKTVTAPLLVLHLLNSSSWSLSYNIRWRIQDFSDDGANRREVHLPITKSVPEI